MSRQSRTQKRRYILIIALVIFLCFIGLVIFVSIYFDTTKIVISGNETYTESEMKKKISSEGYIGNTLFMSIKNRIKKENYFPFIDETTMSFHDPHVLEVKITEKVRAGAVKQGDNYFYFNLAGKVLEKQSFLLENIPVLEDTKMDTVKVGEMLPTTDERFTEIVQTVRGISNNGIEISKITLNKSGELTLTHGKFKIQIGSSEDIDAKLSKIPKLLEVVEEEYESGTINMKLYTESSEIITFTE